MKAQAAPKPFTVDHFRAYARNLVLDNGNDWDPEDFQLEVAADIFAGVPEVWMIVPEGNAKTTLMSGLALYHGDYTPTATVLMAAASRDQAGLLFDQAAGFVTRSGLNHRFRVYHGYRRIDCKRSDGRLQVFAADDRTGDGVIPTMAFLDELHRHRDLKLYRTWRGKLMKRDGQMVAISTAGEPGTEFEDARAQALGSAVSVDRRDFYTRAVGENVVIHDFSVPQGQNVEDMEVVKRANPLHAISLEDLGKKRRSPAMTLNHWRRFCCNQAVRSEIGAIDPVEWAKAGTDERIPEGAEVSLGLDLGWRHDTTAIVPLWMPESERRLIGRPTILVPPRDGSTLAPTKVKQAFRKYAEEYAVKRVVMDPDRGPEIAEWLENELGVEVIEYSQTTQPMTLAYERFMEALRYGWLHHPMHSTLTEHVLNAVATILPDGKAKFDRPSSSRAQAGQRRRVIDGLIAAAIVHSVEVADDGGDTFIWEVVE